MAKKKSAAAKLNKRLVNFMVDLVVDDDVRLAFHENRGPALAKAGVSKRIADAIINRDGAVVSRNLGIIDQTRRRAARLGEIDQTGARRRRTRKP